MNLKKKIMILLFSFLIGFSNPLPAFSITDSSVLAPEVKEAFQKGLLAAEQGAWDVALKYFKEVREKSPFYAPVFFNLGLVHANNGAQLPAIAWFRAYLASGADEAEKAKVEAELMNLEVGVEAKALDVLKQAAQLADVLPEGGYEKKDAYRWIYGSYVATGNLEEAAKFGSKTGITASGPEYMFSLQLSGLAKELADLGDVTKAEEIAEQIPDESKKSEAWLKIATHYAKVKDFKKLEMIRPKLKSPVQKNDLRDFVMALIEGSQMDLAKSFMELGDAEGVAGIIFDMSLKKRENEVREFLPKAEKLIKDNDLSQLTEVANNAVILKDDAMLKRLIPRIEQGNKVYSTPGIYTVYLASYYSYLGEYKKADQLFLTIPPDDPNDWAGKNKSFAAREILKMAATQGDFERFQRYLPYSRAGFLPSELGEMFGKLAWKKMSEGKEKDAARIIASCPDGGAIEGWKVKINEPNFHRDSMYHFLAYQAAKEGQLVRAYEFAAKMSDPNAILASQSGSIGDALLQKEDLDGAIEFFQKQNDKSRGMPLSLIELAIKKGRIDEARSWFEETREAAVKNNELMYQADPLITLAEKLQLTAQVQELNHLKKVNAWVTLAAKLESDTTFNPEQTYQEAKAKPPGEVPSALARLAEDYWKRLREIDFLKRTQE